MKEELIFKEHCFAESERNLMQEREHSTGLETEVQVQMYSNATISQAWILNIYLLVISGKTWFGS